jgi:hypothetical protein
MRSWVRVPPPRPAGQLTVSFEFTGRTCFGSGRARPGTGSAEASAAPYHDARSKSSITTASAGQGSHRDHGAVPQARGGGQRRSKNADGDSTGGDTVTRLLSPCPQTRGGRHWRPGPRRWVVVAGITVDCLGDHQVLCPDGTLADDVDELADLVRRHQVTEPRAPEDAFQLREQMRADHQLEFAPEPEEVEASWSAAGGEEGANEHAGIEDDPESPTRRCRYQPPDASPAAHRRRVSLPPRV